jgi:hypothetical protein
MAYRLRFVQRFRISEEKAFMDLEKCFAELERARVELPKGRRWRPVSGREPVQTLIWECDFDSIDKLHQAQTALACAPEHSRLFEEQSPMMLESFTEIYELLDF